MTVESITGAARTIDGSRRAWQRRWQQASPAARTRIQVAVFAVAVLVAFHYSLLTLVQNLNVDTPLAYIGLVPAIALALAALQRRPVRREPSIHDRQLDYILGLPLLIGAIALEYILRDHLGTMFWLWRVDLLGLPLFVAGAVALLFGTRVLWRQKLAILYLLLAWPLPYSDILNRLLGTFTNATLAALHHIVLVLPVAKYVGGSDGSLFSVVHAGKPFELSVVSACSGVDGIVGFVLVGVAFGAIVRGPRLRKALWLVGGILLLWLINLIRLTLVFWAGRQYGESFAINVLHPFIGLVTFNLGVVLMVLALKPFGLSIGLAPPPPAPAMTAPKPAPVAVPRVYTAVAILAVVAVILGVNNSSLRQYDLVANAVGEPRLASYTLNPATPTGWSVTFDTEYDWAKPYFGGSSTWYRYVYTPVAGGAAAGGGLLHSSAPVTADVVNSSDLNSFSAYGVQACYTFHGYSLRDVADARLANGIRGQTLSFDTSGGNDWSIIWWIWPVKSTVGTGTRYERVILYIQNSIGTVVSGPQVPGLTNVQGGLNPVNAEDQRLITERAFLVQFADEVIGGQARMAVGSVNSSLATELAVGNPNSNPVSTVSQRAAAERIKARRQAAIQRNDREANGRVAPSTP